MRLLAPLALLFMGGCPESGGNQVVSVSFNALVNGEVAACGEEVMVGVGNEVAELADARIFISTLQFRNAETGEWVDVDLSQNEWQTGGIALLDFEDGTAACADSGTAEMNRVVTGQIIEGEYDSFRYDVGVPFEDNHLDSASAPAPLNSPGMFWTWQGGYKFVRVDFAVDTVVRSRWNVHVGSGGCASDAPTTAPTEECVLPNRATVRLNDFPLEGGRIEVELSELVATADLGQNTEESPPGCMSAPADGADCLPTFSALGLSIDSGACVDNCDGQRLFDPIVAAAAE